MHDNNTSFPTWSSYFGIVLVAAGGRESSKMDEGEASRDSSFTRV